MFRNAQIHRQTYVQVFIEPMREVINQEHRVTINDFLPIVSNHPFVPFGREHIYAQGLHAGITGDFLASIHLLVPQVENSIRHLLQQMGEITSGFSSSGIQDERSLNITIYLPELKALLGEDLVFDLQGLLVERFGQNLRNRMAHGLMNTEMFFSVEAVYFWWLVLRICFIPVVAALRQKDLKDNDADEK
jgi:hypothetical protein